MVKPVMFLRTALTEQRIDDLEKQMARVLAHLKLRTEDLAVDQPHPDDAEWEAAAPSKLEPEPDPIELPRMSKATKGKR